MVVNLNGGLSVIEATVPLLHLVVLFRLVLFLQSEGNWWNQVAEMKRLVGFAVFLYGEFGRRVYCLEGILPLLHLGGVASLFYFCRVREIGGIRLRK